LDLIWLSIHHASFIFISIFLLISITYLTFYRKNGFLSDALESVKYIFFRQFWGGEKVISSGLSCHHGEYYFYTNAEIIYGLTLISLQFAQRSALYCATTAKEYLP
jgi:hypothetical protein